MKVWIGWVAFISLVTFILTNFLFGFSQEFLNGGLTLGFILFLIVTLEENKYLEVSE